MPKCLNCLQYGKHPFCSFGHLSQAYLEDNSVSMEYPRGSILFREGSAGTAVFILCSGKVKVSASSRDGRTMILRVANSGDVLGMSAALTGRDYEVTAESLEPCRVRVLHLRHLTAMLEQSGDTTMAVARTLAEDYQAAFDEARLIALPASPAGRVARLILDWAAETQKTSNPKNLSPTITISLTHEEVASMTATTRETVTRTLGRFRKARIISTHGASLTILQRAALERAAAC